MVTSMESVLTGQGPLVIVQVNQLLPKGRPVTSAAASFGRAMSPAPAMSAQVPVAVLVAGTASKRVAFTSWQNSWSSPASAGGTV